MKKELKKETGITLVALVITIIVLLILAGVAIATLSGRDNIISKAQKARDDYNTTSKEEEGKIGEYENAIKTYTGGGTTGTGGEESDSIAGTYYRSCKFK